MLRVSEQDGHRRREGFVSSYRQLGASLIDLQEAADRVFDTISQRIAEERHKLAEISERIQKAKAGIDSISASKGSLIIRSPSKYPSTSASERDFRPLFGSKDGSTSPCVPVTNILVDGGLNRKQIFQISKRRGIQRCRRLVLNVMFICGIQAHKTINSHDSRTAQPTFWI